MFDEWTCWLFAIFMLDNNQILEKMLIENHI